MSTMLFRKKTADEIEQNPKWNLFGLEVGKNDFEPKISINILDNKIYWQSLGIETPLEEDGKIIFPKSLIINESKYNNIFLTKDKNKIKIKLIDERATCLYPFDNH